jgi:hypothetical protein
LANAWAPHRFPVIRHCRGFLLARLLFSKRMASSALTAAVLAESPPANSVSEREANDQGDSDFQHSDKCAEPATRPPEPTNTSQGQGLGNPRCVFIKETRPVRQGSWPTLKPASVLGGRTTAQGRVRPVLQTQYSAWRAAWLPDDCDPPLRVCAMAASNAADMNHVLWPKRIIAGGMVGWARAGERRTRINLWLANNAQ